MTHNSDHKTIIAVFAELVLLAVLIAATPVIVYYDTANLSHGLTEESKTELLHDCLLIVSIGMFVLGYRKFEAARGYLALVATVFTCMLIRESDLLLDKIWHGFWAVPALAVFAIGVFAAVRNKGTVKAPFLKHLSSRSGTFIFIGMLLLIVFSRLFGNSSFLEAIMGDAYSYSIKTTIQEALELVFYTLIAYGSIISYRARFGLEDT